MRVRASVRVYSCVCVCMCVCVCVFVRVRARARTFIHAYVRALIEYSCVCVGI